MAAIVATPLLFGGDAIELGNQTWRKRLLPVGKIVYQDRVLTFDKEYLQTLATAFNSGAYDQVPLQLADAKNSHTNDPDRFRGEVTGMSVSDDGLYVTISTTDAGSQLLQVNPKLGVSARIVEDYARADGQYFPAAIQHVLGTLDPRITSLGPWQPVDMSNAEGADLVIDLSAESWSGEPGYEAATTELAYSLADLDETDFANMTGEEVAAFLSGGYEGLAALGGQEYAMANGDGTDDDATNGLTAHGKEIYRKLIAKNISAKVALAMAKRAQKVKPGAQLANDGYPDMTGPDAAITLAYAQAATRQAEDEARPMKRAGGTSVTEDRLQTALGRISAGTYMPTQPQRALGFANPAGAYAEADPLAASSMCTCADGVMTRYHVAGCPEAMSCDEQGELARSGMYDTWSAEPFEDANGRTWNDQRGNAMTTSDMLEALTGVRQSHRDTPFDGLQRRELLTPQRVTRFGDIDGGDPGDELTPASRRAVAALRGAVGLPDHAAARQEQRDRAVDRLVQQPARRYRTYGEAMEHGESTRERADRYHQPVTPATATLVGWSDGCHLPGELATRTYG